ncbi:MAG: DUF1549 domain-containing protein, partial [Planctomycetaceae bacterium]|nr:DUF1549 domain-containing protein [Planctomycetaceae bacterium]
MRPQRNLFTQILLLLLFVSPSLGDDRPLAFERDIRPIFRAHCFDCHGATEEMKGGLDLRLVRLMERGGDSGPAITPGDPNASYLLDRVRNGEMPPGDHHVPADQVETLTRWLAAGAPTARPEPESIGPGLGITPEERSFWAFQPITRPETPDPESFAAETHVRTPLDAVLVGNAKDGKLAPQADRDTLIVRAYFDLVGLPPSPEEVQRWSQDPGTDWFDRLLTELLDSPHYGERWGRHW